MKQKRLVGRRRFLTALSTLAAGGALFGYKAFSKDAEKVDASPSNMEAAAAGKTLKNALKPNARLGINFSGIAYWATELPFANLMHQSGDWVSQPPNFGKWGKGPKLALDKDGWVKKLEAGCRATKVLCSGKDVHYASGTYVVLYDGEGEIKLHAPIGKIKKVSEGRLEIDVDATRGMLAIDIVSTNPENYMRNIRFIAPGLESSYQESPWNPAFIKRWSGVACVRMMDMMATNNATQSDWSDRPKPTDTSYAKKGVPAELLIDLANRLDTDVWFCMPHLANDEYIKQFALLTKAHLKPHLQAWVEYSNEVWNGGFRQHRYAVEKGLSLGLAKHNWEAAEKFNAYRSVQIFKIWEQVFVDQSRFVRVLASQTSNIDVAKRILNFKLPDNTLASDYGDVLAIANYVGAGGMPTLDAKLSTKTGEVWGLDQLFGYLNNKVLPEMEQLLSSNQKIATEHGLKLVAYEAGQHLVGKGKGVDNEKLTALFLRANADERMGDVYTKSLTMWQQIGGDLICSFNSVEIWSKWGSWGLLQHADDQPTPKFKAVMDWAKTRGQKVSY